MRLWLAMLLLAFVSGATASSVAFDFAWVGNAGNAPDPATGFGAVPYEYAIAKTEVTNAQYTAFLNAVDPTGENRLGLYNPLMEERFGGIEQTGVIDGARYVTQSGRENNPATYISWYDAVRFANWMHNGQGDGDTETGAYALGPLQSRGGVPLDGSTIVRNPDARYFLPSENEWYKAAYHDKASGKAGVYFDYAVPLLGADGRPISDTPEDNPGAVNYVNNDFLDNGLNEGFACCDGASSSEIQNPFTDVGAYFLSSSPYGTLDQNGSVGEWNEQLVGDGRRGGLGGSWSANFQPLRSDTRDFGDPVLGNSGRGFRIASIPEPGAAALVSLLVGVGAVSYRSRAERSVL
ncbi:MAG: SUMF1/EgtB/PvdO family nonheme iron enzyme [Planctomycetota bacterium]